MGPERGNRTRRTASPQENILPTNASRDSSNCWVLRLLLSISSEDVLVSVAPRKPPTMPPSKPPSRTPLKLAPQRYCPKRTKSFRSPTSRTTSLTNEDVCFGFVRDDVWSHVHHHTRPHSQQRSAEWRQAGRANFPTVLKQMQVGVEIQSTERLLQVEYSRWRQQHCENSRRVRVVKRYRAEQVSTTLQ